MTDILRMLIGLLLIVYLISMLVLRSRKPWIPVWSIMSFAAFAVVLTSLVSIDELGFVVNIDVILFLIGMFSIIGLAESSGLLNALSL